MIETFDTLWHQARGAFRDERCWSRARTLALSALACLGRRTISGMLCTSGQQFTDWSAAYRLFRRGRFDAEKLFAPVRRELLSNLAPGAPVVAHLDDTRKAKRGRKVSGTSWHRDPLGPRFRTNFIWAQRFLQTSLALPEGQGACRARAIPVDLRHCPCEPKPRKSAPAEAWSAWREKRKASRISTLGAERLRRLRETLDEEPTGKPRVLIASVDGGYTNAQVLKHLPERTALIGRIRKDAHLYGLPGQEASGRGRKRVYGEHLPTPDEIRADATVAWRTVRAWAAGKVHDFDIKTLDAVRWRAAGAQTLRLLIVRPLSYRLTKHSRLLYREPAFLICTDASLSLEQVLQAYLWRWEIEVNLRDEKTLLGMGQAQVRHETSAALVPAFIVAAYAYLQLSVHGALGSGATCPLPRPKWRKEIPGQRITTQQMIALLRADLWGQTLKTSPCNFSGFAAHRRDNTKPEQFQNSVFSAILSA